MSDNNSKTYLENILELIPFDSADCTTTTEFFNLRELIDEILVLFMPAAKTKNLALEAEYDARIPEQLLGNRSTIYQIIQNLMGNAIKFTHQGGISIKVVLGEKSTAHEAVVAITVQDTGIGISKDKQKIIFERLTRLTPSYEGIYTGAGIGLYLVQKFTHALLGQVYLESEETKGSRFTVVLPLRIPLLTSQEYAEVTRPSEVLKITAPFPVKIPLESAPKKQSSHDASRPPLKILLIEDNKIALKIAKTIVEGMHHHADSAENSTDAITLFMANQYDLVLTDIGLPDLDGYRLTEKLREIERHKNLDLTPIIALTAHDATNISNKAHASGIDAILSKPFSEEKMLDILENFVYATPSKNLTPNSRDRFVKKAIDLEEGAKILGEDHALAQKMLLEFMESLPQTRADIESAFRSKNLTALFDVIHQFYGGLCYVGTPYLRQAAKELENALLKKEKYQVNRLYQRLLDEISSLEKDFS